MDYKTFQHMFDNATEVATLEGVRQQVRETLEDDRHYFFDISGNGTEYVCSGARNGVGFATCTVKLLEDATCVVAIVSVCVPKALEADVEKLCRLWNKHLRLKGLVVKDSRLCFVTAPFDPTTAAIDVGTAVGLGFCTIHHYAPVVVALESGAEPWDLIDFGRDGGRGDDGEDDDDEGGVELPDPDELLARIAAHLDHAAA